MHLISERRNDTVVLYFCMSALLMLRLIGVCVHVRMVTDDRENSSSLERGFPPMESAQGFNHSNIQVVCKKIRLSWVFHCVFLRK